MPLRVHEPKRPCAVPPEMPRRPRSCRSRRAPVTNGTSDLFDGIAGLNGLLGLRPDRRLASSRCRGGLAIGPGIPLRAAGPRAVWRRPRLVCAGGRGAVHRGVGSARRCRANRGATVRRTIAGRGVRAIRRTDGIRRVCARRGIGGRRHRATGLGASAAHRRDGNIRLCVAGQRRAARRRRRRRRLRRRRRRRLDGWLGLRRRRFRFHREQSVDDRGDQQRPDQE